MSDIKKGTIVWYYDDKQASWKRGKVFCVNRWGVNVKPHHGKPPLYFAYNKPVIPASQPKPDCDVETYRKRSWSVYNYKSADKYKLLKALGFA